MDALGAGRFPAVWAAVLLILAWTAVRVIGAGTHFPLAELIAYTPYVTALALLLVAVAAALRNWAATIVAGAAACCLVAVVLPRAVGGGEAMPPGGVELRVLAANVHHGSADPGELVALVRRKRPDVLTIEELTPGFARRLAEAGIGSLLPRSVLSVRPHASGGGIFARLPLSQLPSEAPEGFRMPRALVALPGDRRARIVAVHPYPPKRSHLGLWREGLQSLPPADEGGPAWVLAGDFNATLDHAPLQAILESGYRDAAEVTGDGLEPTWPVGTVLPPPVTIDHVLAEDGIAILGYSTEDIPGSDHRAVFARLGVP